MRVLTGIQPSGQLHLGNYFGAMKPVIAMQAEGDVYLFIANYHALTTVDDPVLLKKTTEDVALDFLACGLDPGNVVMYRQSDVPEVTELTWLLSVVTPMGLLERCTSYKDKIARGVMASHGLFSYPVLMAADILSVQANVVPVGRDQKQHLEVARDLAMKFNRKFGEVFTIPEPKIQESVALVPGLDGQKMSKSYDNIIELFGSPKAVRKKIMRIVTDSKTVDEVKDPEESTIFALYKLLSSPEAQEDMAERFRAGGMGYGDAKKALCEKFEEQVGPFREKRAELSCHPAAIAEVLTQGAAKARGVIQDTLRRARRSVGLE